MLDKLGVGHIVLQKSLNDWIIFFPQKVKQKKVYMKNKLFTA